LPARRCQRVAFSIFLCFFLRIRLRRFLISDPMPSGRLAVRCVDCQIAPGARMLSVAPEIVRLDHVQLAMPPGGEDRAEAFYAGLLGLQRVPKPEPLAARGGCWFVRGATALHLGVEEDFRPARKAHPALVVRDLASLEASLLAAGVAVRPDPDSEPGRGSYVDDPFGNRIELIAE
jgi:catechol 2,3-dioxygenase-like lactoylglutathione lyase family enzyme